MNFQWYLALKYFKGSRKGSRFLSFIKIMAIAGVAIGSAGLLIALSIAHGFKSTINDKVLGFAPNISVATFSADPIFRTDTLMADLKEFSQIKEAQPVVTGQVMIQSSKGVTGTLAKGVDQAGGVTDLKSYIIKGTYQLGASSDSTSLPGIIIGDELAKTLQAQVGDRITTYTMDRIPTPLDSPEIQQFILTGVYETGIGRFDQGLVLMDRKYAKELFKMPGLYSTRVEIRLKDPSKIKTFDEELAAALPYPYYTETIYNKYGSIFAWIELQEETTPFIISVMIIVAAFNLIGTILMMVLERSGDIGILKTMGTQSEKIRSIFLLEGVFVGATGLTIGIGLSLLFTWLQGTYHLIPLPQENYYMSYAPVEPHLLDFVLVAIVTMVLCALASWLPARIAAKTDPLKVIAYGR